MRTTRKQIENRMKFICSRTGVAMGLNYMQNIGYRVTTPNEGRDLSPLLKAGGMIDWLDGFNACLDILDRKRQEAAILK